MRFLLLAAFLVTLSLAQEPARPRKFFDNRAKANGVTANSADALPAVFLSLPPPPCPLCATCLPAVFPLPLSQSRPSPRCERTKTEAATIARLSAPARHGRWAGTTTATRPASWTGTVPAESSRDATGTSIAPTAATRTAFGNWPVAALNITRGSEEKPRSLHVFLLQTTTYSSQLILDSASSPPPTLHRIAV